MHSRGAGISNGSCRDFSLRLEKIIYARLPPLPAQCQASSLSISGNKLEKSGLGRRHSAQNPICSLGQYLDQINVSSRCLSL